MSTVCSASLSAQLVHNYMDSLTGQFFKILPMKESNEPSLDKYLLSLQRELIGSKNLITALQDDGQFLSLLSILQYFIDNNCTIDIIRSDVFKAINLCKKLQERYGA